jgi:hypothetical protein
MATFDGIETRTALATHLSGVAPLMIAGMALALSNGAFAQKPAPGDRVYDLHSEAQGTCPELDWHIVASPNGVLSGMFARPDRKIIARVSGTILPHAKAERFGPSLGGDPSIQQFSLIATEVGHHQRIANITGIIQPNGWMIAIVEGPGVACEDIKVPLLAPAPVDQSSP